MASGFGTLIPHLMAMGPLGGEGMLGGLPPQLNKPLPLPQVGPGGPNSITSGPFGSPGANAGVQGGELALKIALMAAMAG